MPTPASPAQVLRWKIGVSVVLLAAIAGLVGIAVTGLVPVVLMASKNVQANNLKDFIAEIRANPGKYTYGGSVGSPPHVMGAWMNKVRNIRLLFIL